MKHLILITILTLSFLQAKDYHLLYKGIDAGIIKDFSNLDKGYFTVTPTHFLAKAAIQFNENLVFHLKEFKPKKENTYFKEDRNNLIGVLNFVKKYRFNVEKDLDKNRTLVINCQKECTWELLKENKVTTNGFITFLQNGEISEFADIQNNIKIQYF